jgi:RNA polymerase sigma factor (sigma-70 family)
MRASNRAIAFKSWIYEIARNACIDEFRRANRCPEISVASDADADGRELAGTAHSPETYLERRQQMDDLRGAFSGLSEDQHKVLVLRELEGRSYAEIAAHTGMTVPIVQSTLFRARRRLGQEYDEIASGRRCEQVHALVDSGGEARLGTLGLRERRRFARHIAHCQPCRRHALLAGIDESALQVPSLAKKIAALFPLPFVPWRGLFRGGRISHLARSLHKAGQIADPAVAAGAGQTALAVMAAAIVVTGGIGGGVGSGVQRTADTYAVAATQVQVARPSTSPAPARASTQQNGGAALAHQVSRAARGPGNKPPIQTKPAVSHNLSPKAPTSLPNAPAPSAPSSPHLPGLPSIPTTLRLPALPGHPLKSVRKDVTPVVHKLTSPTKRLTRTLDKLPPKLKKLVRLP